MRDLTRNENIIKNKPNIKPEVTQEIEEDKLEVITETREIIKKVKNSLKKTIKSPA